MKKIRVCCAIIRSDDKILAAKRGPSMAQAGCWEFPGGKVEAGESDAACLKREIAEELNLHLIDLKYFTETSFTYPDFEIELVAYLCDEFTGIMKLAEHEEAGFWEIKDLSQLHWAPADLPIVKLLIN